MPWNFIIMLALMVVSAVITSLTAKNPTVNNAQPAQLSDFNVPQIAEGTAQAVVFGDVWLTDWMVLYYGNLRSEPIYAPKSGGKK